MIHSAGILLYRRCPGARDGPGPLEVWLGHMGGPFWARRDEHAWSIPKGGILPAEDPLAAALREFNEEIGTPAPAADYVLLGSFRQSAKKTVTVYAAEADFAPERIAGNTFALEWPPGSGIVRDYAEIDDAGWFSEAEARTKMVKGQVQLLDALKAHLDGFG
ncbi:NUDIX domain-containing protein [Arthrobacter sp. APC 3897]|uniref:NUDIX domain-containing protein n=1 Tax=Arthrobacter sp. APC 3897 TaxID=3035204 RepID=UPI0025B55575|nr:NUDIX domain-containing protein [Arthrobacter sp. APC 3897]MDN3481962.1 NUDIX domain-containing protein [Arthrobacter sp. APC 3897]